MLKISCLVLVQTTFAFFVDCPSLIADQVNSSERIHRKDSVVIGRGANGVISAEVNFGVVPVQVPLSAEIVLLNTTNRTFKFKQITVACQCQNAALSADSVAPGEVVVLKVDMQTPSASKSLVHAQMMLEVMDGVPVPVRFTFVPAGCLVFAESVIRLKINHDPTSARTILSGQIPFDFSAPIELQMLEAKCDAKGVEAKISDTDTQNTPDRPKRAELMYRVDPRTIPDEGLTTKIHVATRDKSYSSSIALIVMREQAFVVAPKVVRLNITQVEETPDGADASKFQFQGSCILRIDDPRLREMAKADPSLWNKITFDCQINDLLIKTDISHLGNGTFRAKLSGQASSSEATGKLAWTAKAMGRSFEQVCNYVWYLK